MNLDLLLMQALNGLQFGILLFLMAAGLTLVFGIMSFINLAHGALYMMGAYFAASAYQHSDSFLLAIIAGFGGALALGVALDRVGFLKLYPRAHLDQVLATFGVMLFCNEAARMIWGPAPIFMGLPESLAGSIMLMGIPYPAYRLLIILAGLLVALGLYLLIERTRIGMLIRAGASNRSMVAALGVNIGWLNTFIFALGAGLAGLAGAMVGPILSVQAGMGDSILILTLVVIVIGGIGSIRGAFLGALVVGVVDTLGRTVIPTLLRLSMPQELASTLGAAIPSLAVYVLMVVILALKPEGLFPVKNR
ncbi:MAG TPA: branched-chain amino acid ABC transporter permease [Castellaniella sp.]|nr:branched-chain amino acid ABC transporter permease [Castellaniella sp.]